MKLKQLEACLSQVKPFETPDYMLEQYPTSAHLAARILYAAAGFDDVEGKVVFDLGTGTGMFAIGAQVMGAGTTTAFDIDVAALEQARCNADDVGVDVDFVLCDVTAMDADAPGNSPGGDGAGGGDGSDTVSTATDPARGGDEEADAAAGAALGDSGTVPETKTTTTTTTSAGDAPATGVAEATGGEEASLPDGNTDTPRLPTAAAAPTLTPQATWSGLGEKCDTVFMNPPFGTRVRGVDMAFLRQALAMATTAVYTLHKSSTRRHVLQVGAKAGATGQVLATLKFDVPKMYAFHRQNSKDIEVDFIRFDKAALRGAPGAAAAAAAAAQAAAFAFPAPAPAQSGGGSRHQRNSNKHGRGGRSGRGGNNNKSGGKSGAGKGGHGGGRGRRR